ncbi:Uncharacterised protein [Mycobacteroides abscessus subsp. massiliense]|uniref:Uncharacterized protein n=1 Tax=Mycobacteroides abscessus subsp. massiliense TaxID=1962118 RepID=A0A1U2EXW8_9MYCO|nr:Uncharacterised protein [Mycobacteroides abscessus subsp. massiliense]SKT62024.1 Uncharacterised protein [Mycobacteroides abscessus subsp. massiliense]SKT90134.1 Uncharacterised protein [Mycobacteroides abscessus subsp. massiliense]SKX38837.1 Uncharacterised protein [Mycobacteroides abscessus subsp. massiliense]
MAPAESAVIAATSIPSAIAAVHSHAVFQERGEGGAISPFPHSQVCFTVKFPFVSWYLMWTGGAE